MQKPKKKEFVSLISDAEICFSFKNIFLLFFSFLSFFSATNTKATNLEFIENKGQWNKNVLYKTNIENGAIFFENNRLKYHFYDVEKLNEISTRNHHARENDFLSMDNTLKYHAVFLNFEGAKTPSKTVATFPQNHYYNYFIGKKQEEWASEAKAYQKIRYYDIYEGIDLVFYVKNNYLKYDFELAANADVKQISMFYEGADDVFIKDGRLIVKTSVNEIKELKPYSYQIIDGEKVEVACDFKISKQKKISFHFPNGFDNTQKLIIDPTLVFSTYSGSTANNFGYTATFDSKGHLYSGSTAFNIGYPTSAGAYQSTFNGGNTDVAISKYSLDGTTLMYSTYLGGNSAEQPHSLIVNNSDELFIFGTTSSPNFAVLPNAYDTSFNGGPPVNLTNGLGLNFTNGCDIFVSRLSANGSSLLASTYLGGSGTDGLNSLNGAAVTNIFNPLRYNYADEVRGEVIIDENNNIYIGTCTRSTDFPTTNNAFQTTYGGGNLDACLSKLDNNLTTLIWSSYYGGNGADAIYSLDIDKNNDILFTGGTTSTNLTTTSGVLNPNFQGGRADGFIGHVSKNGNQIINASYFGTSEYDQSYFIQRDKENNIYIYGQTQGSANELIENALYNTPNSGQFITKMTIEMDSVIWSTRFGTAIGVPNISPAAFLVDVCNKIYLSGWGGSVNGFGGTNGMDITPNAVQSTTNNSDFYLMVIEDDVSAISYATYFGSPTTSEHVDGGTSRFDKKGRIYQSVCASCGGFSDFPTTPNAHSSNNLASCNNAVFKFDFSLPIAVADFELPPIDCTPYTATFNNLSISVGIPNYQWFFGDGNTSTDINPTHTFTNPGTYDVTLVIIDTLSCNFSDTIIKKLTVLSNSTSNLPNVNICSGFNEQIGLAPTGLSGIIYQWTPSTGLSDPSVSNPIVNTNQSTLYQLIISNGICADTLFQQVNLIDAIISTSPDTLVCKDDLVTLNAYSSGFANVFLWSNNINFSNILNTNTSDSTYTFTALNSGKYYVKAGNGICDKIDSVFVTVFGLDTISPTNILACKNEVITLSFVNPYPNQNLTFSWQNNPNLSPINDTSAFLSPNTSGNFNAIISNGFCADTVRFNVTLSNFEVNAPNNQAVCSGINNTFTANSNGNGVSYVWSNNLSFTDTLNTNINSGSFTTSVTQSRNFYVYAIDNNNCVDTDTLFLQVINGTTIQNLNQVVCKGTSFNLDFSASVNQPNITFSWIPANAVSNPNAAQNNVNINQNLNLMFVYGNGTCNDTIKRNFEIINNELTVLPPFQSCGNDAFNIGPNNINFNSSNVNYSWTPNVNLSANNILNPVATPNNTTTYQLIISSGNLTCRDTIRRTINVTNLIIQTNPDTMVCKGQNVSLSSSANISNNTILWSSNSNFSNNLGSNPNLNINNIQNSRRYYVRYTNGICQKIDSVLVEVIRDTSFTLPALRYCINDSVEAGLQSSFNYIYTWIPSSGLSNPNISNPQAAPNVETDYLLIRDFQGICFDSIFQNIGPDNLVTGNYSDTLLCFGENLQVLPQIINGNFNTITWSDNSNFSDTIQSSNQIIPLNLTATDTSFYYVMIENNFCAYKDSFLLNVSKIFIDLEDILSCVEDSFLIPSNTNPSQNNVTYFWNSSFNIIGDDDGENILIFANTDGQIFLEVINNEGCLADDSMRVIISPLNNFINIYSSADTILEGQEVIITFDEFAGLNYTWSPSNVTYLGNGRISVSPEISTTYTLTIEDENQTCILEKSISIIVEEIICKEPNIFVPNAFTPNGDGNNDILFVNGRFLDQIEFSIYNRWGEKVFETKNQNTGWDGTYKGMNADPAVFVYHLKAICIGGEEYYQQGNITLIR
jgi:gliding motility-associated-like protein